MTSSDLFTWDPSSFFTSDSVHCTPFTLSLTHIKALFREEIFEREKLKRESFELCKCKRKSVAFVVLEGVVVSCYIFIEKVGGSVHCTDYNSRIPSVWVPRILSSFELGIGFGKLGPIGFEKRLNL